MIQEIETRNCQVCGSQLKGRSDKKFCDDYCRAAYNNGLKSVTNNRVRNINNALGKNRRILEELFTEGGEMSKISREKLLLKGFFFKYITHFQAAGKGKIYYYCYDYGYLALTRGWYLIVKSKEK